MANVRKTVGDKDGDRYEHPLISRGSFDPHFPPFLTTRSDRNILLKDSRYVWNGGGGKVREKNRGGGDRRRKEIGQGKRWVEMKITSFKTDIRLHNSSFVFCFFFAFRSSMGAWFPSYWTKWRVERIIFLILLQLDSWCSKINQRGKTETTFKNIMMEYKQMPDSLLFKMWIFPLMGFRSYC